MFEAFIPKGLLTLKISLGKKKAHGKLWVCLWGGGWGVEQACHLATSPLADWQEPSHFIGESSNIFQYLHICCLWLVSLPRACLTLGVLAAQGG